MIICRNLRLCDGEVACVHCATIERLETELAAAREAACVPAMPDDVAELVERLERGVEIFSDGQRPREWIAPTELERSAASAIKAQAAEIARRDAIAMDLQMLCDKQAVEIERLQAENVALKQAALTHVKLQNKAEAKLREAVEVMRWYAGDGSTYDGIDVGQRARAFLSTMEASNGKA